MLEKVFYTSVLVTDQDKALDFYTNVLGLEKRVENPTPDGPRFLTVGGRWMGTPRAPAARAADILTTPAARDLERVV